MNTELDDLLASSRRIAFKDIRLILTEMCLESMKANGSHDKDTCPYCEVAGAVKKLEDK